MCAKQMHDTKTMKGVDQMFGKNGKLNNNKLVLISLSIPVLIICSVLLSCIEANNTEIGGCEEIYEDRNDQNEYLSDNNEIFADGVTYFDASTVTDFGSRSDYPIASDMQMMYEQAEYIVVGSFGEFKHSYNMARDQSNPIEEDEGRYFEGHVYGFNIESVLKGTIEMDSIYISIPYLNVVKGEIRNDIIDIEGVIVQPATETDPYEIDTIWEFYMEPIQGEVVILFLSYNELFDHYFAAIEPYMIVIGEDGSALLKSNLLLPQETREEMAVFEATSNSGRQISFTNTSLLGERIVDTISGSTLDEILFELGGFGTIGDEAPAETNMEAMVELFIESDDIDAFDE